MAPKLTEKARLQRDTEELVNLVLPVPREVISFFNQKVKPSIGRGYEFAEYITERKGRLFQRVFCFQCYGLGKEEATFRECARRYEGGSLVVSNLAGGYYMKPYLPDTTYKGDDMHESGWVPQYCCKVPASKMSMASPWICLNEKKWLQKYPYCAWEQYRGKYGLFNYICNYRSNKRVELLVKAGYDNFIYSLNSLNVEGKTFEEIFKVKQPFAKEFLKRGNIRDLHILRKQEWIDSEKKLNNYKEYISQAKWRNYDYTQEEIEYFLSFDLYHPAEIYGDYLKVAKKLAYPLNEKRYRFPKDLKQAHDDAMKEYKVVESKLNDDAIKKISDACQSLCYEKDGYKIFPVTCTKELIHESDVLEHCVRRYAPDVAEGKSLIMFVRKVDAPDTPFVTLELIKTEKSKTKKAVVKQYASISQVRAYKNAAPDEATAAFVMDWKAHNHLTGWRA